MRITITPSVWNKLLVPSPPERKGMRTCFAAHDDVDSVYYGLQRSLSLQFIELVPLVSWPKERPVRTERTELPNTIGTSVRTGTHTGLF